jgi:tetratricopeptide (TPR) repeat protein
LLASVAELRRRVLSPDHPATLSTDNALAATYREQGKFAEAIALFQSALERRTRVLSAEHHDTLRTMHALALTYSAKGDFAAAMELLARTVALRERVLGPSHPDTQASVAALRKRAKTRRSSRGDEAGLRGGSILPAPAAPRIRPLNSPNR